MNKKSVKKITYSWVNDATIRCFRLLQIQNVQILIQNIIKAFFLKYGKQK